MWSPTTNTTSDNKKKEENDDCSCSSGSGSATSVDAVTIGGKHQQRLQLQQQLNTFETNSKKQPLPFGGNLSTDSEQQAVRAHKKEKELALTETGDSGFISGPQTAEIFQEQDDGDKSNSNVASASVAASSVLSAAAGGDAQSTVQKYNISVEPSVDQQQQKQQQQQHTEILDSGCIDVEYEATDDIEHEAIAESINDQKYTTAASINQSPTQQQQATAVATAAGSNSEQMILKQNVDAGMSEWFCNLSLQTETAPQLQPQPEVAAIGLNNLNGAGRKPNPASASVATTIDAKTITPNQTKQQATSTDSPPAQTQQQQAIGNTATATTPTNMTASTAWEQFYQQNDDGDTPMHLACISGYVDVVAALIRMAPHPCLFNIQNDEAQTPLHLAALTAQPKILRMLLIAGAEPTVRDRHGNTALHLACLSGEEQCVRALIIPISASEINEAHRQYGHRSNDKTVSYLGCARLPSDLEIRNYDGERCVHLSAQAGYIDILRILVLYGADINAREGKSGRTPLHIAIECCNEDLANFLLDECQKLNLETATYAGLTAYQVACILNKSQMQNILERRGAEPLTPPDSDYDSSDIEDLDDSKIYDLRFGDPGYFSNYNGRNPMTVA